MKAIDVEKFAQICLDIEKDQEEQDNYVNALFVSELRKFISTFPTVDAAPVKHGKWETDSTEQNEFWGHYCNRCSTYLPYGRDWRPNYCPECGAKMDLEEQDANNI